MNCYFHSNEYSTGRIFDETLFNAIACLSDQEIASDFDNLSSAAKDRMCYCLLLKDEITLHPLDPNTIPMGWFLQPENSLSNAINEQKAIEALVNLDDEELNKSAFTIGIGDDLSARYFSIQPPELRQEMLRELIKSLAYFDKKDQLAQVHAIAKGMATNPQFKTIGGLVSKDLSDKIQGSIDPKMVANSLQLDHLSGGSWQKAIWIKAWILDPSTPIVEIKRFLQFVTGQPCLGANRKIEFHAGKDGKLPVAHTCFSSLDLSNDLKGANVEERKKNFFNGLNTAMLEGMSFENA